MTIDSPPLAAASFEDPAVEKSGRRLASIDFVRGLAMVFMALDHTRDFICNIPFEPENIDRTWTFYFLVRWVTHFCAPAFFFLAGVSAYLYGRKHSSFDLQKFLAVRGLWLIVLEFTVIGFAWTFHPGWGMFGVICCLGLSMILLAAVVQVKRSLIMAFALLVIATHDLFDGLKPAAFHTGQWLLIMLHRRGGAHLGFMTLFVLFPLIPWFAVTLLGFSMGSLFESGSVANRRRLAWTGLGACLLFIVLRATNAYGNPAAGVAASTPGDWHPQATLSKTLILFFDVEKYPPSLQYLLMTLGPILLLLAVPAEFWGRIGGVIEVFGRVPLFYYILHLYAIHLAASLIGVMYGQPVSWLFHGGFFLNYPPDGYGHGIGFVCVVWVCIVLLLYWPCAWFAKVKSAHPGSLLRFL